MSEAVRQELADAVNLSDIDPSLNVSPYFKQTTKAGSGMVRLDRINYPNPFGGITTWNVLIVLSSDIAKAEQWMDEKVPAIAQALSEVASVRNVTPQQLLFDSGTVPVVTFELTRETESE